MQTLVRVEAFRAEARGMPRRLPAQTQEQRSATPGFPPEQQIQSREADRRAGKGMFGLQVNEHSAHGMITCGCCADGETETENRLRWRTVTRTLLAGIGKRTTTHLILLRLPIAGCAP